MKVTIDSDEPLADVLRVVGSMYDVTLTTADDSAPPAKPGTPSRRPSKWASNARSTTTISRRTQARQAVSVDPKLVRQWAQENGHDVNARGALPASIREAYRVANPD